MFLLQWGHDFRPDYLKLSQIRALYPNVPLMALTATANNSVVQDCMRILQMKDPYLHSQSFNRYTAYSHAVCRTYTLRCALLLW